MEVAFQGGFASALLDVIFNKLTDFVKGEFVKITDSDNALQKLQYTLMDARKVLREIDPFELQFIDGNILQKQVNKLTFLLYDSEDFIEDLILETAAHCSDSCDQPVLHTILSRPTSVFKPRTLVKLQNQLEATMRELKSHLTSLSQTISNTHLCSARSKPDKRLIIPLRKEEIETIVQELVSQTSEYLGVSILGGHGIGKTWVAAAVEIEPRVVERFGSRLWVDVGGQFEVEHVIQQLNRLAKASSANNGVGCHRQHSILIILDNLRGMKSTDWTAFWLRIKKIGIDGSCNADIKILITTFDPEVAVSSHTSSHHLNPLSDEDCRNLIIDTTKAFGKALSKSDCSRAVSLTQKCGGLPSVAIILGEFFSRPNAPKMDHLLDENLWKSDVFRDEISPVLRPFYSQVPPHLKRCLGYLSLFPHNHTFTCDDLVQLWVGEGFIQEREGPLRALQTAKKCFSRLLAMSILRCSHQIECDGVSVPVYKLNPFSLKFAQLVASNICSLLDQQGASTSSPQKQKTGVCSSFKCTRHMSFKKDHPHTWNVIKKHEYLRTCMSVCEFSHYNLYKVHTSTFKSLTRLRILTLRKTSIENLPDSIKCLKLLHYLDISQTRIKRLPETLSRLRNLRFLRLTKGSSENDYLDFLPQKFGNLTNMIYLDWTVSEIRHMGLPSHIGNLCSLQTLPLFPVGKIAEHSIAQLMNMNNLQGSISIVNLENVGNYSEAVKAKLCDKRYLETIELVWTKPVEEQKARKVLDSLKPSSCLKELIVKNYGGVEFPEWLVHSLPGKGLHLKSLERLHLESCPCLTTLPQFGRFNNLKVLILEKLKDVATLGCSQENGNSFFRTGHFLKLEELEFRDMELPETVTISLDHMPCLRVLKFSCCRNMTILSTPGYPSSLNKLKVKLCHSLGSLPNLPKSLVSLEIVGSYLLTNWCNDRDTNWSKISFITKVEIDGLRISTPGSNCVSAPRDQDTGSSSDSAK